MDQPRRTHEGITWQRRQFLIEQYAVLTENAPELRETLAWWIDFYRPASPGESELMEMAVMASIQRRRVQAHLTEVVNQQIRTAVYDYDCAQQALVQKYRALLPTQPGAAVLGLKLFALGVRFLISRWERLLRLLRAEGTWYGKDLEEAINYQGAKGSRPEDLYESVGAYLTWTYCVMTRTDAPDEDFAEIGYQQKHVMPKAIQGRKPEHWLPMQAHARQLLEELVERELKVLRPREEYLRLNIEEPAQDGAEITKQVLAGPEGARLLRQQRMHEQHFHRAYDAFLKGRKQSDGSGRVPGAPVAEIHGAAEDTGVVEPRPESDAVAVSAEAARAERKRGANSVAPGAENGIGAHIVDGDIPREAVVATGYTPPPRNDAAAQAETEANGESPPAPVAQPDAPAGVF